MARNEADTRVELIDPALHARGWHEGLIKREKTPGGTDLVDGRPVRRRGRVDYLLCVPLAYGQAPLPVAVLEAKAEDKLPALGLQQARDYGTRFALPIVISTNGHLFAEWNEKDRITGASQPMNDFPTPDELKSLYEQIRDLDLDSLAASPLAVPYRGGDSARYYFQDAAIRSAIEKIAKSDGPARVLLSLATGTGKTVIASHLLHKIAEAGQLTRALFVCDRDELRTQAITHMQAVFGDNAQVVTPDAPRTNARVLVASYQTLNISDEDDQPKFWMDNYPPGFFSHIVIDEAHRSAWGKWSVILSDNPEAVHIGLTATPRTIVGTNRSATAASDANITAHNIEYFGPPVYEYTLSAGQADGYLAACQVIRRTVDLDRDGLTRDDIVAASATDPYTGREVQPNEIDDRYSPLSYEAKLMLPDRVQAMSQDLFDLLVETGGPHQKSIVFGVRDAHATQLAIELSNIYERWCAEQGVSPREWYAFQCTGNPDLRPTSKTLIADFKGSRSSHYLAITVDLLATGVDVPDLANVVFFKYVESPISFYQMVGRGTRTGNPRGSKSMFRLYDYTNATRLFGEPFESRATPEPSDAMTADGATPAAHTHVIQVEGFNVRVEDDGRAILVERGGVEQLAPIIHEC